MEAGLSGQTRPAACVLGAAATGNVVETQWTWGGRVQPSRGPGLLVLAGAGASGGQREDELQGQRRMVVGWRGPS